MTEHDRVEHRRQRRRDFLWYASAVGIICAALLGLGTLLGRLGLFASWATELPIRREIAAAADSADRWPSVRRMMWREQHERTTADDSLRNAVMGGQQAIQSELHEVHRLLTRGH